MKHKEKYNPHKIHLIILINFLFGLSIALIIYVASVYYQQASGSYNVSVYYLLPYSFIFLTLLNLHKVVRYCGKVRILLFLFVGQLVTLTVLLLLDVTPIGALLLMAFFFFSGVSWVVLDAILETYSSDERSGHIRGLYLTALNTGILLGPIISTQILEKFNYHGIFVILLIIYCVMFLLSLLGLRDMQSDFHSVISVTTLVKKAWRDVHIRKIYWIAFTLSFFYALLNIYTPLYLLQKGLSLVEIGYIFTVMLIPFVLFQYPAGVLADKRWGEKEFLAIAFVIMAGSVGMMAFITSSHIALWMGVLFVGRVGAALAEIMRDSYFYKLVNG